jgi:hypothetical protein
MKKILFFFCMTSLIISCGTSSKSNIASVQKVKMADPSEFASSITSDELKTLLYKYASDEFEGRNTGEKGQKMAVEYLKSQYKEMAIASPLGGDDYFQEVPLEKKSVGESKLSINGITYNKFEDHVTLVISEDVSMSVNDLVYVGYGIDADNYSDYKNIDVKGKIVLVKAGEPKDTDGNYITSGDSESTQWTDRSAISSKRDAAKANGAEAILFVDNALFSRYAPYFKKQAETGLAGRLSLINNEKDILMLVITEDLGKVLHPSLLETDTPKTITAKIDLAIENKSVAVGSENVVAFIKGSEKPDEILVISAHLDHIGIEDGEVYNGADDDGSGTVAILEIAEAFRLAEKAGSGPKRSILFLHVTGEEKGLLGSRHYTDNDPIFPLENTVADLNIDMIGRSDPKRKEGNRNYVYLIGSDKLSTELHNISEEVNKKYTNIELDYTYNDVNDPNRFYYRSDHYNFAKNNVPVIFYFNGTHDDYHKASDTPDKIEYDLLENRTRLVFYTAWEIANRADRIVVDKALE